MLLAIDLGSTSFKASVYTDQLQALGLSAYPLQYSFGAQGEVELSVATVRTALQACIADALSAADCDPSALRAIAITSQAQTFTVLDPQTGSALLPFISWQDDRAGATCEQIRQTAPWGDFAAHAGFGSLQSCLQAVILYHLAAVEQLHLDPHLRVAPLPTYCGYLLSGEIMTDRNLAAMSGLYSLVEHDWWTEGLAACGLSPQQMPALCQLGDAPCATGAMAREFGLPAHIPIIFAGNDQTAGAYSAEMHAGDEVLLTLGTAMVTYAVHAALPAPQGHPVVARGPYVHQQFFQLATDGCGGNILQWAVKTLLGEIDYPRFFALASSAPPQSNGVTFHGALVAGQGAWQHLSLRHQPADLARAVLEELTQRAVDLIQAITPTAPARTLWVAGGGHVAHGWLNMLRDAYPAKMIATDADPRLGAAAMARDWLATNSTKCCEDF
jgi:xylulokinase